MEVEVRGRRVGTRVMVGNEEEEGEGVEGRWRFKRGLLGEFKAALKAAIEDALRLTAGEDTVDEPLEAVEDAVDETLGTGGWMTLCLETRCVSSSINRLRSSSASCSTSLRRSPARRSSSFRSFSLSWTL